MAFSAFERMVAFRYLRARRQEGFISVIAGFSLLGIALGVGTLIVVMSVMNGFRAELLGRILGMNGHVNVVGTGGPLRNYLDIARRVATVPGVISTNPLIEGQVMATGPRGGSGALVRGMRPDDLAQRLAGQRAPASSLDGSHAVGGDKIIAGNFADFQEPETAVVGSRLAGRLGLGVGDDITLLSPQGQVTAFGTVPRVKSYRIAALFQVGMFEYDNNFVFLSLEDAQKYFRLGDAVNSVEVLIENPDAVRALRTQIFAAIGQDVRLVDWLEVNATFFGALQVERNVMFLILTLIIVVAAFNIISSMIMLVKDKGRDIAILRTMGATRPMVLRIFFLTGASVGIFGTVFGFLLGLGFAANIEEIRQLLQQLTGSKLFPAEIYFLARLPAKVDPTEVATIVGMALLLTFLATIYPAWRAARLDPVEALRYE